MGKMNPTPHVGIFSKMSNLEHNGNVQPYNKYHVEQCPT
jgi:hypothetical protein